MVVSRWGAVAAGGLAVALIAGVTVDGAAAGASTHARKAATFRVSKSGTVSGPGHLAPGRVKINVRGPASQDFQLVRSRHGAGKAQLLADASKLNSDMPDPVPLERDFVLAGGTQDGHALYVTLKRGTYYAIDTDYEGRPSAKQVKQIVVRGKTKNAAKPKITGTVTAVGAESWSGKPKSIKHKGTMLFTNRASQPHFLVLTRMKKGTSKKDIVPALTGQVPPGKVFYLSPKYSFALGVISPHAAMRSSYSLPKGQYAEMCFWPDPKTHMPHAFMGMVRTITLK